ncbi:helix-turn-helix domain-containing protein [Alsobacter sp. R-9]
MRNADAGTRQSNATPGNTSSSLPTLPTLLTVSDVAEVLRVSTRTVRRLIKSRALASVTVGRSVRVRAEDLAALTRPR